MTAFLRRLFACDFGPRQPMSHALASVYHRTHPVGHRAPFRRFR